MQRLDIEYDFPARGERDPSPATSGILGPSVQLKKERGPLLYLEGGRERIKAAGLMRRWRPPKVVIGDGRPERRRQG